MASPLMEAVALDAFSEEGFDAVAWVNGALAARPAEEPLDMHVGELLMRMALLGQDVQYNLRDHSDLAMMNLPRSQRDMELIQTEAGALHAQTERIKQQLEDRMRTSDGSRITHLGELDAIKLTAEGCVEKLNEAEKLDNLRLQVENAFRSDDLAQMAQRLGAFRDSLAVVGELRQGKLYAQQLEEWTEGIEAKVVPLLKQTMASADGGVVQYREVLENIGRGDVAEDVYRTSVHERTGAAWQAFSATENASTGAALSAWVKAFFATAADNARQDMGWCGELLPSPSSTVRGAVAAAVGTLSPSFAERISASMAQLDAIDTTDTFCALHGAALQFAEELESICQDDDASEQHMGDSELAALFRNFVTLQKDYTQWEAQRFSRACKDAAERLTAVGELSDNPAVNVGGSMDALQSRLAPVLEELCAASIVAVKRCVQACGGVEMERLLRSLDDGFVEYFEAGASAIEQCRPDDPAIAYNLLALTDKCKTQFDVANAAVRKELLALRTQLHPSSTDTSTAILRRVGKLYCALDGRRSARLAAMLGKQVDENCAPIFESSVAAAATCSTSALLQIFHVLFKPIHSILSGLSKLEVWGTAPTQRTNPSGFSSPPSDYIHGIAQSLLDVPTMVQEGSLSTAAASELWEVLAGGALDMSTSGAKTKLAPVRIAGLVKAIDAEEDEEQAGVGAEDEEDAAYNWLVLVAKGTVAMLLAQVDAIPRLTEQGATQLAADLSHWAKVLGAGEMEPGPVLLQAISLLKMNVAELGRATVGEGEDADLLRTLCKLRQASQASALGESS